MNLQSFIQPPVYAPHPAHCRIILFYQDEDDESRGSDIAALERGERCKTKVKKCIEEHGPLDTKTISNLLGISQAHVTRVAKKLYNDGSIIGKKDVESRTRDWLFWIDK